MADIITVQFAALEQASTDFRTMANHLAQTVAEMQSQLSKLQWTGAARDSYTAAQTKINQGVQEVSAIAGQISGATAQAEQDFVSTETANTRMFQTQ